MNNEEKRKAMIEKINDPNEYEKIDKVLALLEKGIAFGKAYDKVYGKNLARLHALTSLAGR